ncbi:MAG: MarR family transcriptional regulator [Lachnospiraceae bacterium]|nr:MarR family transcriptional regulator [Lachnospiraceae bacterium]
MDYKAAAIELLRIQAKLNRLKAMQQMDGYTQGEIFALGYLHETGQEANPKDIGKVMAVSSARVAVLLNNMEKKGWICRLSDQSDNRKTLVAMTDLGEEIFLERQREVLDSVSKVLQDLGEDDTRSLIRIHEKISQD